MSMSFADEIRRLQKEKPDVEKEKLERNKAIEFRDACLAMNEEALLKLYEGYKEMLRHSCQHQSYFNGVFCCPS